MVIEVIGERGLEVMMNIKGRLMMILLGVPVLLGKARIASGRYGIWSLEAAWRLAATTSTWTSKIRVCRARTKCVLPDRERCQVFSHKQVRLQCHFFVILVFVSER